MSDKHICIYSERPDCSAEDPCSFCAKKSPFSDEELEMIDKWLDENKELMDDLVKAGD